MHEPGGTRVRCQSPRLRRRRVQRDLHSFQHHYLHARQPPTSAHVPVVRKAREVSLQLRNDRNRSCAAHEQGMNARSVTLILVDSKANSNKFYTLELDGSGRLAKTYGRVGSVGVTNYENTGLSGFNRILHEKKRKGYTEVAVAEDSRPKTSPLANNALTAVAKTGLTSGKARTNTVVEDLIERIVRVNAHDVFELSGGLIKVDTTGRVKTPLGLVTAASIRQASTLLDRMEQAGPGRVAPLLEEYLKLVPQKVSSRAGWADTFFNAQNTFQKQRDFLSQLSDSVSFFDTQAAAAVTSDAAADAEFKYKIRAVSSTGDVFKRVQKLYEGSRNSGHAAASLRLKNVFELVDQPGAKTYAKILGEIGNEQQLWHGTRAANLLSILRKGLYVPPVSGTSIQTVGRMFGDGVYLSSQSTKSLNYSHGYWGGSGGRDNNCFMLLADAAMGSEYRPTAHGFDRRIPVEARTTLNKFGKPWNSINVKAGTAGVRNHEAVVWNTDQIRLRYLCEFDR